MPEFTDEQMDARLHGAGARWREATPVPTLAPADRDEVEIERSVPAPPHHRRTWVAALTGAAVVAAAVVIGVAVTRDSGSPQPAGQSELAGTSWQLTRLRPSGTEGLPQTANLPAGPGLDALLEFTVGGKVSGSDGCNSFSGPVDIQASKLVLGNLAITAMGCPDIQASTARIDRILVGDVGWTISNGQLVLTKAGVGELTYAPKPAPVTSTDPAKLVGVTWGLSGVEQDTGTASSGSGSSDTSAITLTFDGVRGFRVEEPCRAVTGNVRLGRGSATFSNRVAQEHSCPQRAADAPTLTAAVDDALSGRTVWSIVDGTLTITKAGTKLIFTRLTSTAPRSVLLGTTWLLSQVTSPTFRQPLDTTKAELKLTIDQRGSLSVDDGVNFHSVPDGRPVAIGANTITLTGLGSTLAGCAPTGTGADPCTRATVISDFFAGTIVWSLAGSHLTLTKGGTTLVYGRT
ncbi:MAG TPA: META domain-containing protein [Jatrophihabitans sp.]|uniref:META domain-containing protein n=1 Tax=Jatrophihabitans sp. TaxID=1932789 RepID=UPI002E076FB4|nr:META domain-containing protein [Jatrophihabitans sp.]